MRINARLDAESERHLHEIRALTGATTSQALRAALRSYRERLGGSEHYEALVQSGFIGCAEGPGDLSERYKEHLTDALDDKHPR